MAVSTTVGLLEKLLTLASGSDMLFSVYSMQLTQPLLFLEIGW